MAEISAAWQYRRRRWPRAWAARTTARSAKKAFSVIRTGRGATVRARPDLARAGARWETGSRPG